MSTLPKVAADQIGRVHIIWAECTNPEENTPTDTGYYRVLTGETWSAPVDVLAVPYGDSFNPYALTVDPYGRLVLVWTQSQGVNVSIADAGLANMPQAWTTTRLDEGASINSADIAIDRSGVNHLVYVRNNRELTYLRSDESGARWSEPVTIAGTDRNDHAIIAPALAIDEKGVIYTAWTNTAESTNWGAVGVDFARSTDGGINWGPVQTIANDGGYGSPDLLVDAEQNLHIVWMASGATGGRYHRWSKDQGLSWSDRNVVMRPEDVTGFPGLPTLLLDSAGAVHVIFAGYSRNSGIETIWYSLWDGLSWRQPIPISGDLPDSQAASAAIGLGHQIYAAWVDYGSKDVWATSYDTGSQALTLDAIPLSGIGMPTLSPKTSVSAEESKTTATPQNLIVIPPTASEASQQTSTFSQAMALVLALVPVVLLVSAVTVYQSRRRR